MSLINSLISASSTKRERAIFCSGFQLYTNFGQFESNKFSVFNFTPILSWSRTISENLNNIENRIKPFFIMSYFSYFLVLKYNKSIVFVHKPYICLSL